MKKALIFFAAAMFTLAPLGASSVKVASPNGGESWAPNTAHDITWTSQNPGSIVVNITLRHIGGGLVGRIQAGVTLSAGVFHWTAGKLDDGTLVPAASDYIIRIRDAAGAVGDDSDGPFAITGAFTPRNPSSTITPITPINHPFPVLPPPDFENMGLILKPNFSNNRIESIDCKVQVRNNGGDYHGPLEIRAIALDSLVNGKVSREEKVHIPDFSLAQNSQSEVFLFNQPWPDGVVAITFGVVLDPSNLIAESNENNNTRDQTYSLPQKADLVVDEITVIPDKVLEGGKYTVRVQARNIGTVAASGFDLVIYRWIQGFPEYGIKAYKNLSYSPVPGTIYSYFPSFEHNAKDDARGVYGVRVELDPDKRIDEDDRSNNTKSAQFEVLPAPDLTFGEVTIKPYHEDKLLFEFEIRNAGHADSGRCQYVILCDGRELFNNISGDKIASGKGEIIEGYWNIDCPKGLYGFTFRLDPDNKVAESDETNNEKFMQYVIK